MVSEIARLRLEKSKAYRTVLVYQKEALSDG